jgi:hypothetical protein
MREVGKDNAQKLMHDAQNLVHCLGRGCYGKILEINDYLKKC